MTSLLLFHKPIAAVRLQYARLSPLSFLVNLSLLSFVVRMLLSLVCDPAFQSLLTRCSSALQELKFIHLDAGVCKAFIGLCATIFLVLLSFLASIKESPSTDLQGSTHPRVSSVSRFEHTEDADKEVYHDVPEIGEGTGYNKPVIAFAAPGNHDGVRSVERASRAAAPLRDLTTVSSPSALATIRERLCANSLEAPADEANTSLDPASRLPAYSTGESLLATRHVKPVLAGRCQPMRTPTIAIPPANSAQPARKLLACDPSAYSSMPSIDRRAHSVPSSPNRFVPSSPNRFLPSSPNRFLTRHNSGLPTSSQAFFVSGPCRRTASSTYYYEYAKEATGSTMTLYTASTIDALSKEEANQQFSEFTSRKWASMRRESQKTNRRLS